MNDLEPGLKGRAQSAGGRWVDWLPLVVLLSSSCLLLRGVAGWQQMIGVVLASLAGFKWPAWRRATRHRRPVSVWRSLAFFAGWPGMDARPFVEALPATRPRAGEWAMAVAKLLAGLAVVAAAAVWSTGVQPLLAGYLGACGLLLTFHFGWFHVHALVLRRLGIPVQPIMDRPLVSQSLGEYWGKRWNRAFRDIAHEFVFKPLVRPLGIRGALVVVFLFSAGLHELAISWPARGGYGMPTAYFLIQALGMAVAHSSAGQRWNLNRGWRGRLFALAVVLTPLLMLFHPLFVRRVVVPMVDAIQAALAAL